MATTQGAQRATRIILAIQLAVTVGAAVLALVFVDVKGAYSALIGGGINVIATLYFALKVFSARPGSSARQIARAFYIGEVIKILLTGVLFIVVIVWLDVALLPLFLTYAITMLAFWLALPFTL